MLNSNELLETYERLKAYPNLLVKVKEMLDLIEKNKVESVDDFEEALIPQVRKFGVEIVQTWAAVEEDQQRRDLEGKGLVHHSKKNSSGILRLAT
jgi:hypothetical protein